MKTFLTMRRQKLMFLVLLVLIAIFTLFYTTKSRLFIPTWMQRIKEANESLDTTKPRLWIPPWKQGGKEAKKSVDATVSSFGSVCQVPGCLARYESIYQHSRRIPSIRHILWKNEQVSAYVVRQLKTWNATHPDWTYVLWRDSDLEKFVAKHYTGALRKYKSLPIHIMRIDMMRYLILHRFGGVYADLDYMLVRPLDRFQKFPAVVTREAEAHAIFNYGVKTFPPPIMGNLAFMMSEPGHPFFEYCTMQLVARPSDNLFWFAGPHALGLLLTQYATDFSLANNPDGVVMVPPSRNFYGFPGNSLAGCSSTYKAATIPGLQGRCNEVRNQNVSKNITEYCKDVTNLDPITDRNELMYAVHDSNKPRSSYSTAGAPDFDDNLSHIRTVLPSVVMADTIY